MPYGNAFIRSYVKSLPTIAAPSAVCQLVRNSSLHDADCDRGPWVR